MFWDHLLLIHLNALANKQGLRAPFKFVTPINADNGEVFLSTYFEEQQQRNESVLVTSNSMCTCSECCCFMPANSPLLIVAIEKESLHDAPLVKNVVQSVVNNNQTQIEKINMRPAQNLTTSIPPPNAPSITYFGGFPPPYWVHHCAFQPPSPLMSVHWIQNGVPQNMQFCFAKNMNYQRRKLSGFGTAGRPPHDKNCQSRINSRFV